MFGKPDGFQTGRAMHHLHLRRVPKNVSGDHHNAPSTIRLTPCLPGSCLIQVARQRPRPTKKMGIALSSYGARIRPSGQDRRKWPWPAWASSSSRQHYVAHGKTTLTGKPSPGCLPTIPGLDHGYTQIRSCSGRTRPRSLPSTSPTSSTRPRSVRELTDCQAPANFIGPIELITGAAQMDGRRPGRGRQDRHRWSDAPAVLLARSTSKLPR